MASIGEHDLASLVAQEDLEDWAQAAQEPLRVEGGRLVGGLGGGVAVDVVDAEEDPVDVPGGAADALRRVLSAVVEAAGAHVA